MNYCSNCGAPVQRRIPQGDNRPRYVCDRCDTVHYQNPKVVVGCIPQWEDKVLLCRRAIEPRYGLWTLPAGFMENGETTAQAAMRETLEEAEARIDGLKLYTLFNLPHIDQVYVIYRANLLDLDFAPGEESIEVALFAEADLPWQDIAFAVIGETLRIFFNERASGHYRTHSGDLLRRSGDLPAYRLLMSSS